MWDLKLDNTRDLTSGYALDIEEVVQRLLTRLNRELGEWFLDDTVGLPMYQDGAGLLGSKNKNTLDLTIRKEILDTEEVNRIIKFNSIYNYLQRSYSLYVEIITIYGTVQINFSNQGVSEWHTE